MENSMIKTPIGEIILNINEKKTQYVAKELHPSFRKFKVDKRYQIELEIDKLRKNTTVELYWSDTIKVQCQNCRKCKENGNEKVRSKIQRGSIEAVGRHRTQEGMRTAQPELRNPVGGEKAAGQEKQGR